MKTMLTNRRDGVNSSRRFHPKLFLLGAGAILSCLPAGAQSQLPAADEPDVNAPWPSATKQGRSPGKPTEATSTTTTAPVKANPAPDPVVNSAPPDSSLSSSAPAALQAPKATKNQVSISADYFLGQGEVTLPLGFSLSSVPGFEGYKPEVAKPTRNADYIGATVSYSYGQSWYLDVGYLQGKSSGEVDVNLGIPLPSNFTIDETGYQAYIRYVPKSLRGKRLSAYFRLGVNYVDSKLTDDLTFPNGGYYTERIQATDILGNLGFGVGYRLWNVGHFRLGLQAEAEGFGGVRTQDINESLGDTPLSPTTINNTLFGGIGRGTVRMEYRFGQSGLLRMFADVGVKVIFTEIQYPSVGNYNGSSYNEMLWGPYAKLGLSYSF